MRTLSVNPTIEELKTFYELGVQYQNGTGVEKDILMAVRYYAYVFKATSSMSSSFDRHKLYIQSLTALESFKMSEVKLKEKIAVIILEIITEEAKLKKIFGLMSFLYEDIIKRANFYRRFPDKGMLAYTTYYQGWTLLADRAIQEEIDKICDIADEHNLYEIGKRSLSYDHLARAKKFLQKAIDKNYDRASLEMGRLYQIVGKNRNLPLAAKYFQQCLDRGVDTAEAESLLNAVLEGSEISAVDLNAIADMYYQGEAVVRNYTKAIKCYKKAQEKGLNNAVACRKLGSLYAAGESGVAKNLALAAIQFQKSLDQGHAVAQADMDKLYEIIVNQTDLSISKEESLATKNSLLLNACLKGNVEKVRKLLELRADPQTTDINEKKVINLVIPLKLEEVVKKEILALLIRYGACEDSDHAIELNKLVNKGAILSQANADLRGYVAQLKEELKETQEIGQKTNEELRAATEMISSHDEVLTAAARELAALREEKQTMQLQIRELQHAVKQIIPGLSFLLMRSENSNQRPALSGGSHLRLAANREDAEEKALPLTIQPFSTP